LIDHGWSVPRLDGEPCNVYGFCHTIISMLRSIVVTRKKIGRPPTGFDLAVAIRIPQEMLGRLDREARKSGISRSELVRRLIQRGLES
jgi:hypothetical protein